tara:strand:+ start:722 stop:994 length:273 start_codon:yes stop_codon:yes gene_type:complete
MYDLTTAVMNELDQTISNNASARTVTVEQTSKKIKLALLVSSLSLVTCLPMMIAMVANENPSWALVFALGTVTSLVTNILARFWAWWNHG